MNMQGWSLVIWLKLDMADRLGGLRAPEMRSTRRPSASDRIRLGFAWRTVVIVIIIPWVCLSDWQTLLKLE